MPASLTLSMACSQYNRTRPLIDGSVKPEGIALSVSHDDEHLVRQRKIQNGEYDVCEFFTGTYISDLPIRALGFTALPVFPLRLFRHSNVFIGRNSDIRRPSDLNGRRIGLRFWSITAGLWMKGILEEEYGVDLSTITWVTSLPDSIPNWSPPPWLKLETAPAGMTEYDLLLTGNTAAAITADWWQPEKYPDVTHLFANYEEEERAYFQRTRCIPIMHTLVVRTRILEEEPWVAQSLFKAWEQARHLAEGPAPASSSVHAPQPARPGTPVFNEYGFSKARPALDRLLTYAHRQAITPRKYQPEDMFWPSMLDT